MADRRRALHRLAIEIAITGVIAFIAVLLLDAVIHLLIKNFTVIFNLFEHSLIDATPIYDGRHFLFLK